MANSDGDVDVVVCLYFLGLRSVVFHEYVSIRKALRAEQGVHFSRTSS